MSRTPQQPPSKLDYETAADIERAEHEVITSSSAQQFPPSSRSRKFLTKLLWLQIILPAASICLCIVIFALESYGRKRYHYRKLPPFDGLHVALTFWVTLMLIIYAMGSLFIDIKRLNRLPKGKFNFACMGILQLIQHLGVWYAYAGALSTRCRHEDLENSEYTVTWEECLDWEARLRVLCRALALCAVLSALVVFVYVGTLRRLARSFLSDGPKRKKSG